MTPARASRAPKRRGRPRDEELPARRRAEILDAASRVFAERGYRQSDVQQIADAAAISKGCVYCYFASKRELFLAAVDRGMTLLRRAVDCAAERAEDPLEKVARGVRAYLAYFDRHPELIELLIQERSEFRDREQPTYFAHREKGIGRWRELWLELMRSERVRRVPVERILDVVSDLLYGTIFTNHFSGRTKSFERQARDILDVFFRGVLVDGADPGAGCSSR